MKNGGAMTDTNALLKQGIAALKAGQKAEARLLLKHVVQKDKDNETAWLWLSGAVDTDRDRIHCLRETLRINPNNQHARRGLEMLETKAPTPRPAQPVERKPTQPPPPTWEEKKYDAGPIQVAEKPPPDDTKQCPYCAETIKAEAKFCRFCGRNLEAGKLPQQPKTVVQQAAPPRKKRNPVITCLAALGFIAVVFICLGSLISTSSTTSRATVTPGPKATPFPTFTPTPDHGSEYTAIVECRDAIREQLLVPKSAKFDSFLEPPEAGYEDGIWHVIGKVEAQNAFGVMIPYSYYCEVRYQNGRYLIEIADLF